MERLFSRSVRPTDRKKQQITNKKPNLTKIQSLKVPFRLTKNGAYFLLQMVNVLTDEQKMAFDQVLEHEVSGEYTP
jgi:hypothetical protein